MKTADLEQRSKELLERAQAANAAGNFDECDALLSEIDNLKPQLTRAKKLDALDASTPKSEGAKLTAAPEVRAFAHGPSALPTEFAGEVWQTRSGERVPALAPKDSLRSLLPAGDNPAAELGLGGFLRALHGGAQSSLEQRVLAGAAIGTGGAIVPTQLAAEVIDMLRAQTVTIQAGARTVPMTSATLRLARQLTDPAGGWRAENAAIAESDPTFDQVTLTAKSWAVRFNVSRELLEDGQNTDAMIRNILASSAAVGLDQAVLVGSGTANQPLGIRGQSGIQAVSMGTNGAALTNWTQPLNAVQALETANAGTVTAMVMAPRTARAIYGFADSTGQPLQPPPRIANVPVLTSTSVPVNETQGTANNASSIFLGDFREVLIGLRTDLQITVLQERFAELGQIGFIAWMRADVALARPAAIARIAGVTP